MVEDSLGVKRVIQNLNCIVIRGLGVFSKTVWCLPTCLIKWWDNNWDFGASGVGYFQIYIYWIVRLWQVLTMPHVMVQTWWKLFISSMLLHLGLQFCYQGVIKIWWCQTYWRSKDYKYINFRKRIWSFIHNRTITEKDIFHLFYSYPGSKENSRHLLKKMILDWK